MTKIWLQLSDFKDAINVPEKDKEALFHWAGHLTRKLESVKYHRDNVIRILNEELQKRAGFAESTNATFVEVNTGVEKEFEAFLMQGKSTLDVLVKIFIPLLVKIFIPLFGIKLHSYGRGGEKILRTLQGNLNKEQLARAERLLTLIEEDKPWIEKWFCGLRDTVAHYKPISSSGFVTPPIKDGVPRHAPPATDDGVPFQDAVGLLYENLLTFSEDFLALAVSITFHPMIIVGLLPEDHRDNEYPRKYGMFLAKPPEQAAT